MLYLSAISGSLVLLGLLAGCASTQPGAGMPEPRPLGRDLQTALTGTVPALTGPAPAPPAVPDTLTLHDALALVLHNSRTLRAYGLEVGARDASALQAGLPPNPIFEAERENFGGNLGTDRTETTVQMGLPLEIFGQRAARRRAALLNRDLAGWDYESHRLDLYAETVRRYAEAAGAREHLALVDETVRTAEQILEVVAARVEAGKVSPTEETRTRVLLSSAQIQRRRAVQELQASQTLLAALWGHQALEQPALPFEIAPASLGQPEAPPSLEAIRSRMGLNPDLARWDAEVAQREAALSAERTSRLPTPTVSGGYRWFEITGEHTFVGRVGLALPLFNRNQGAVRSAHYRIARAEAERESAETFIQAELAAAHSLLEAAFAEVSTLQDEVVPAAEQAYEAVEEGYRLGKFGFLDVLDARRTLTDVRTDYVRARVNYFKASAHVERLTASPLSAVD